MPNAEAGITQAGFVRRAAREIGVESKYSAMGRMMMWIGGVFIPEARESVEMIYEFEEPFVVDSSRFEDTFEMKATPMEESIHRTVQWYRDH